VEEKEVIKYASLLYSVSLGDSYIVLSRKFPPASYRIRYDEVVSVEHKRPVDYSTLVWVLIYGGIIYAINSIQFFRDIIASIAAEVNAATSSVTLSASSTIMGITALFVVIGGYYAIKFIVSLVDRVIVYRTGKEPIAMPMPLNDKTRQILGEVNAKVNEAGGVSKIEVERLITERITSLLDERTRMQEELVGSMKMEFERARTEEERAHVRKKLKAGVKELKSKDEIIDRELKKTGITKEEVFKKYRIRAPNERFIESMLRGGSNF